MLEWLKSKFKQKWTFSESNKCDKCGGEIERCPPYCPHCNQPTQYYSRHH